ncbi:phorbol esters/diacylglycerol binding domain protein [Oesophagostomum dentatum]|uniref:Phorbol esters/diacylglycerol binding domain protein n=1 Tax=Oesophagostomum dentatum TaxID=61180 RepID=A0A0B1TP32_OESDE|nr:phorbol esters/diacylglycerol binding domain protein [Oesophagostomum dentatum]
MALLCYLALNHLGTHSADDVTKTNVQSAQATTPTRYDASNSEWTNEVLAWIYNNFLKVPGPLEAWIKSLNDAAKKVNRPTECEVIFDGFGDHMHVKQPPRLSHIRVEHGPREHLTLRTNIHLPCVCLKVVSSQRTPERLLVSNFDANIVDLRGEVECRFACIANQLFLMGCFNGRPEMDIELTNTDSNAQSQVSLGLVEEKIRRCLLSAVTNINLSEALPPNPDDWRMDEPHMMDAFHDRVYHDQNHSPVISPSTATPSPKPMVDPNRLSGEVPGVNIQVPELFKKLNESHFISPMTNNNAAANRLRLKIIKANHLGRSPSNAGNIPANIDVQQPYVVIEMDEPAQKHTTTKGLNTCPYWEESFDFDLTPASEEILFEVYDAGMKVSSDDDKNFLGLAIVNFEEIRRSGEHLHNLKLQGRPYRKDDVTGELTVQFDFYYDPKAVAAGKLVDSVKVRHSNGSEFRETVTTQRRAIYDPHDNFENAEVMPRKTTTVVVKTVSQQLKEKPAIQSVHGSMENAVDPHTQQVLDQHIQGDPSMEQLRENLQRAADSIAPESSIRIGESSTLPRPPRAESFDERRGREREKKPPPAKRDRSFFGELRDRLSGRRRSQTQRSKSMDVNGPEIEEAVSLPPSRDPSRVRYAVPGERYNETQSVGGKSGESSKSLYQHSTLVLELEHEKQLKYFLIPPSMLNEPAAAKLMRRGKKLHIYNEHTFVAVKIRGGVNCNVCQQRIKSSFSKQAYQCRDCKLVCHKSCHYKTDAFCTQSNVSKLQIAKDVDWAHFLSHYQLEEFISLDGV